MANIGTGATKVSFGQMPASNFTVVSDTQIIVTSPAVTSTGTVDAAVTSPGGTSTVPVLRINLRTMGL